MAHEFGHALGFDHSFGPDYWGNPDAEYCDPYCIMSCNVFRYTSPWANGLPLPLAGSHASGLPAGWAGQIGPYPAAATTWRYCSDWAHGRHVLHFDGRYAWADGFPVTKREAVRALWRWASAPRLGR